jgi:hypothetical protein
MILKIHNNFYKFNVATAEFLAFGRAEKMAYSVGSWFKCSEETVAWIKSVITKNEYKIVSKIPRNDKAY